MLNATAEGRDEGQAARKVWAAQLAALALAMLVLALRAPDSLVLPQFWAEDGTVFFAAQLHHALPQLFSPYAGYLHLIPRLIAWVASAFSAHYAPAIYNYAALLIGAASIASLRELRLGLGSFAFVLAPFALTPTNGEVFGTLTNVQWLAQFYLFVVVGRFIVGQTPANPWRAGAATALVGLSGPFCLFASFAALVGWLYAWLICRRSELAPRSLLRSLSALCVGILLLCSVIQLCVMMRDAQTPHATFAQWFAGIAIMLSSLQTHFFGYRLFEDGIFLAMAAATVVASLIWIPRIGGDRATLIIIIACVLAGFCAAAVRSLDPTLVSMEIFAGDRYFFAPKILLWWCVTVVIAAIWRDNINVCFAVLTMLLGAGAVFASSLLQRPLLRDMSWHVYANLIDQGDAIAVPLNPNREMSLPAREPITPPVQ